MLVTHRERHPSVVPTASALPIARHSTCFDTSRIHTAPVRTRSLLCCYESLPQHAVSRRCNRNKEYLTKTPLRLRHRGHHGQTAAGVRLDGLAVLGGWVPCWTFQAIHALNLTVSSDVLGAAPSSQARTVVQRLLARAPRFSCCNSASLLHGLSHYKQDCIAFLHSLSRSDSCPPACGLRTMSSMMPASAEAASGGKWRWPSSCVQRAWLC